MTETAAQLAEPSTVPSNGRPAPAKPTVSFVIINKDDRGVIGTLEALRRERSDLVGRTETIVVDASQGRLDDVRDRFPEARWIPFEPRADKPTIPEQRNAGVAQSQSDIIVFIDASCVPDPQWLDRLVEPIVKDGESIVAGGHRSPDKPGIRDEAMHFRGTDPYIEEAPTINMAVRRGVFDQLGGLDESLRYGSDVDFTWRAGDAGLRIRQVPDAMVSHDWGTPRQEIRRSFTYGQARYRLYAKHAHRRKDLLSRDLPVLVYPLYLLLLPLGLVKRWIPLLLVIPLVRNRGKRPVLTVLDHLIFGAGVLRGVWRDLR